MQYNFLLGLSEVNYGPLAGVVAITTSLFAATAAIVYTWSGHFKSWRPPVDVLPDVVQKLIGVLGVISIVYSWWIADISTARELWRLVAISLVIGIVSIILYIYEQTHLSNNFTGSSSRI